MNENDNIESLCPKCGNNLYLGLSQNNLDTYPHITISEIMIRCLDCKWKKEWKRDKHGSFVKQPEPPKIVKKTFVIEYEGIHAENEFTAQNIRITLNEPAHGKFVKVEEIPNTTSINIGFIEPPTIIEVSKEEAQKYLDTGIQPEPYTMGRAQRIEYTIEKYGLKPNKPEIVKNCENCGEDYKGNCQNEYGCDGPGWDNWIPIKTTKNGGNDDLQATGNYEEVMKEVSEIFKNPEIKKGCVNCNYGDSSGNSEPCNSCSNSDKWKPIEKTEIEKSCGNCGWHMGKCRNTKPCNQEYSGWKPKEEENTTKFPEHGKNYIFSGKEEKKENENNAQKL